jgi:hypothetical protein
MNLLIERERNLFLLLAKNSELFHLSKMEYRNVEFVILTITNCIVILMDNYLCSTPEGLLNFLVYKLLLFRQII